MRTVNFGHYLSEYTTVLKSLDRAEIEAMAEILFQAWKNQRTVFCCGNGGSAANASHFMMDLAKLTAPARGPRLRAMALNENVAAISAIANDLAYEEIFAEQLRMFLAPADVVVGFSTSGSSPNVIRAIEFANSCGAITLGITGRRGYHLEGIASRTLVVDSTSVQQVEDATMVVGHLVCLRVKELIAGESAPEALDAEPLVLANPTAVDSAMM